MASVKFGWKGALMTLAAATLGLTTIAAGPESVAKVGQKAPDFTLKDTSGKTYTLSSLTKEGKVVVLEWFNSGCPFVKLHHEKHTTMPDTQEKYASKGVVWFAVNSTNPSHPDFGKDADAISKWNLSYPVLLDSDGTVGKMYGAKTTPHMFIIDKNGKLVYAGAIDDDPRDQKSPSDKVNYVAQALDEVLAGQSVTTSETRSYGCGVKYAN